MNESGHKKNWKRSLLRALLGLGVLCLLIILAFSAVIFGDRKEVPLFIEERVKEQTGADLLFAHYHFNVFRNFPYLTMVLEDISLQDPGYEAHHQELLRIDELAVQFRFWKLFRREFEVRSLTVDGGELKLFKNSDGTYSNLDFLQRDSARATAPDSVHQAVFSIQHIDFNDFTFHYLDSLRRKSYHLDMTDTRLAFDKSGRLGKVDLTGDWFFHGLTFKFKNGAYLHNKEAQVDWQLEWDPQKNRLQINPSSLKVEGETYQLSGHLDVGKPAYLRLVIEHPGIRMDAGRRVIADNIREGLKSLSIDRPVQVKVIVDGPLKSGFPTPTDVFFSVQDGEVRSGDISLTETTFSGQYSNCDPTGPVNPHSGCLAIDTFATRVYGAVPVSGKALIKDLADPVARVDASINTPLEALNDVLPPGSFQFNQGRLESVLHFEGKVGPNAMSGSALPTLEGRLLLSGGSMHHLTLPLQVRQIETDLRFQKNGLIIRDLRSRIDGEPFRLTGSLDGLIPFLLSPSTRQVMAILDVRAGKLNLDHFLPPAGSPKREKKRPAKKPADMNRIAAVVQSMLDRFNAQLSVQAEELEVRGYAASEVFCKGRLLSFCEESGGCLLLDTLSARIYDQIPFAASAQLSDLNNPFMQLKLDLAGPLSAFNEMLPPEKIRIHEGSIDLDLQFEGLLDDYFNLGEATSQAGMQGRVELQDVSADYLAGRFQLEKGTASIQFDEDDLAIQSVSLSVNDNEVNMKGEVRDFVPFLFTEKGTLKTRLDVESPGLNFNNFPLGNKPADKKAATLRDSTLITHKFDAVLNKFEADLRVHTGEVLFHQFQATDVAISGHYQGQCTPGGPPLGCVRVDTFSARLFGNAPFEAVFTVENLQDPFLSADAHLQMPLTDLNALFPSDTMQFFGGEGEVQFTYVGKPHDDFDEEENLVKADISGFARFTDADIKYLSKGYHLTQMDADLVFNNHDLQVRKVDLYINDNPVKVKGQLDNLMPFLFMPESQALQASFEVYASDFSLDRFSAPAKHMAGRAEKEKKESSQIAKVVKSALDSIKADLKVRIDQLKYRNFSGHDLFADIHWDNDRLNIKEARMKMDTGQFHLRGLVSNLANNEPHINIGAEFKQVDMSHIFRSFNNFGQETITHQHLNGLVDAELSFKAQANANYDLDPDSMEGYFDLHMEEGEFIGLPALAGLHGFLVKSRGLEDIRFGSLRKRFVLKDQLLLIDNLELASSALSFKLDGTFDLQKQGKTDLLIEVPLGNLFEKGLSQEALDHYFETKHGPSLLLLFNQKDDSLRLRPVLSRRKHDDVEKE